jgi:hypothetical protein
MIYFVFLFVEENKFAMSLINFHILSLHLVSAHQYEDYNEIDTTGLEDIRNSEVEDQITLDEGTNVTTNKSFAYNRT